MTETTHTDADGRTFKVGDKVTPDWSVTGREWTVTGFGINANGTRCLKITNPEGTITDHVLARYLTKTKKDLGWIATVTALCAIHGLTETWGVKGDTAAEAHAKIADAREGILAAHDLGHYSPTVGKIYPLPEIANPPEPDPIEEASAAVAAQLEDLGYNDRLLVLRRAIRAEHAHEAHIKADADAWDQAHTEAE